MLKADDDQVMLEYSSDWILATALFPDQRRVEPFGRAVSF